MCVYVVFYLLMLHRLFVRFLHLVHLHSHIGLLVLKVSFELCELEENFYSQYLKQIQATNGDAAATH